MVGGAGLPTSNTSAPNAYLNYILFDDNYVPYDFGYDQVSEAGALPGGPDKMMLEAKVRKPGYLYIYVSNENPTVAEVYFDDFKIKHVKSPVLQYNEYYAYGLQTGNSWTREATTPNNFLGNSGTELNTTTSLYDLEYRNYDPALARMRQVDPLASKYASINPYNYSFNNPAAFTDPSGAEPANENYRYYREQSNQRVVDAGAFFRNTSFGAGVFRGGNPQSMFNTGWSPGSGSLSAGSFAGADSYFEKADFVRTVESMAANAKDGLTEGIYSYSGKHDAYGFWLETSFAGTPNFQTGLLNETVVLARFMEWNFGSKQTNGSGPGDGFEKFGVYDAIGFGADMSELYRQGYGAVQFGMRLGKAEQLLADARILKTMTASRTAFNTSVSAFKTAGKGIALIGAAASIAEFATSDMSGGDIAKLVSAGIITSTAFIPVAGPFISVGLGLLDGAGAFDGIYVYFDKK